MASIKRRALWTMAAAAAFALAAYSGGMAQGMMVKMSATLNGASEVPPTTSAGTGKATVTLDKASKTITWEVSYSGLTGDAKAAHFHGPAAPGANAGVERQHPHRGQRRRRDPRPVDGDVASAWFETRGRWPRSSP